MINLKGLLIAGAAAGAMFVTGTVLAQSQTYIRPDYSGGYVIQSPPALGQPYQPPSYMRPDYSGGWVLTQPPAVGQPYQPPTYIRPDYSGGWVATQPGAPRW